MTSNISSISGLLAFVPLNHILRLRDFILHKAVRPQNDLGPQFLYLPVYDRGSLVL